MAVCAVYFSPVGGYIPSAATIKYLSELRDMEIWLAPIAGTRVLVPIRAQGPTPIGDAVTRSDAIRSRAELLSRLLAAEPRSIERQVCA